jgi:hypothetical protein
MDFTEFYTYAQTVIRLGRVVLATGNLSFSEVKGADAQVHRPKWAPKVVYNPVTT